MEKDFKYLHPILKRSISDLINNLQELTVNKKLSNNDALSLYLIGRQIEFYMDNEALPTPPYSTIENSDDYQVVKQTLENIIQLDTNYLEIIRVLRNKSQKEFLMLQGMRSTEGSAFKIAYFPNPSELIKIANQRYNEYLTHLARARAKHSTRCVVEYWGVVSGKPEEQNQESNQVLLKLLYDFTWWNCFEHFKHGLTFELRDKTGHGMRWSLSNNEFLGLIEPIDPNVGRKFFPSIDEMNEYNQNIT